MKKVSSSKVIRFNKMPKISEEDKERWRKIRISVKEHEH